MKQRVILSTLVALTLSLLSETSNARWMDPNTGRFQTMDPYEVSPSQPLSLHKYIYAQDDPVDNIDPSGNDVVEMLAVIGIGAMLDTIGGVASAQEVTATVAPSSVEVYSHKAFSDQYSHAYLKVSDPKPSDFPNLRMQRDPHGENFFTISGEPSFSLWHWQEELIGSLNDKGDVAAIQNGSAVDEGTVMRGSSTALRLAEDLLFSFNNYKNNLPYKPKPDAGPPATYNSNSFEHGILNSVAARGPDFTSRVDAFVGWDNPVPNGAFQKQ